MDQSRRTRHNSAEEPLEEEGGRENLAFRIKEDHHRGTTTIYALSCDPKRSILPATELP